MNIWLFVHVLGAILFVGNIVTAAFWKIRADFSGNPDVVYHGVRNVMLADYVFTLPGLIMIIVSGNVMAVQAGYSMSVFSWLTLSQFLFALTGVVWVLVLIPLQRKMIRLGREAVQTGTVPESYRRVSLYWAVFGTAATVLPVLILYLMVFKNV